MTRTGVLHSWDLDTAAARDLQTDLAAQIIADRPLPPYRTIAGADVSYGRRSPTLYAAVVVLDALSLEVVDRSGVVAQATFPYVPGLLSFREVPPVLAAFERLSVKPDVVVCDGQGIAHPRRCGLAAHLGLWLGIPTIGCAKSRLFGDYEEPGPLRGEWSPLTDGDETIGAVLRTRDRVKPLFVSPGHLCDLASAIRVVLAATCGRRLPETTRRAHEEVNRMRLMSVTEGK